MFIDHIYKMGRFNKLHITVFFPNILSAFLSALMFSMGPYQSIGTVTRKDTRKLNYYGHYFVFEMNKAIRTRLAFEKVTSRLLDFVIPTKSGVQGRIHKTRMVQNYLLF